MDALGAEAQIQANPSCAIKPPLDPDLYAERHKVENFFQRIKRFRRIALQCGKTLTSYMGFAFLALALDWRMQKGPQTRCRTRPFHAFSGV